MGTNSDQHHWLDAMTEEALLNGESDDDGDHSSSASDDNGDEVLASFSSFESLEGSQPQSWRKSYQVHDRLLVNHIFLFA